MQFTYNLVDGLDRFEKERTARIFESIGFLSLKLTQPLTSKGYFRLDRIIRNLYQNQNSCFPVGTTYQALQRGSSSQGNWNKIANLFAGTLKLSYHIQYSWVQLACRT
jgi:hypothetical protein